MTSHMPIKTKDRDTIIQALSAGVVPRTGLRHLQVGRSQEISAMIQDIDRITNEGSAIRFIIGEYGAGKTFFLNLVRQIALERKCVTIHADLAPDRRIHATAGQARALYAEAIRNMSTRTKQDGNALSAIIERFIIETLKSKEDNNDPQTLIDKRLGILNDQAGGYDFITVIKTFWKAYDQGNDDLKARALKWLRAEYPTKSEARQDLGVRTIIDDMNIYDAFKNMSVFIKLAGYEGLVIIFDEMVNLYKLQNAQARNQNYEQILRMLNDTLQGSSKNIGFFFGGTPEFLLDSRRGLYSYTALKSRLEENAFARNGLIDLTGPVIRLTNLTPEELFVLLSNIRHVFNQKNETMSSIPDEAIYAFMHHCHKKIGEAYFKTPRNSIRAFVQMLSVLEQNSHTNWNDLIEEIPIKTDSNILQTQPDHQTDNDGEEDDELTSLRL